MKYFILLAASLFLFGCSGGDGGGDSPPTTQKKTDVSELESHTVIIDGVEKTFYVQDEAITWDEKNWDEYRWE